MKRAAIAIAVSALATTSASTAMAGPYDEMIATHAAANGLPEVLVHRVIVRESRYNPRAVSKGNYGMMQIKLATARGLGYTGNAQGLLDANTNLTYAVKYLAGAYRAAHGNHDLAVSYYARGYYYAAKRQGWNANSQTVPTPGLLAVATADVSPMAEPASPSRMIPPGAAKPAIGTDAAHAANLGDPYLFTIKDQNPTRTTNRHRFAQVANPLNNLFAPAPKVTRRAARAGRAVRSAL